jgi:hypothetical protein
MMDKLTRGRANRPGSATDATGVYRRGLAVLFARENPVGLVWLVPVRAERDGDNQGWRRGPYVFRSACSRSFWAQAGGGDGAKG